MFSFSSLNEKIHGLDRFRGNGPYGKIPTKQEPIRTLGFTLPYNKIDYLFINPGLSLLPIQSILLLSDS